MRLVSSQAKGRTRARAPASVRPDSDLWGRRSRPVRDGPATSSPVARRRSV